MTDLTKRLFAAEMKIELLREEIERLRAFAAWVDSWVANPVGSYSVSALDGLFGMTRDKLRALEQQTTECSECKDGLPSTNWKDGRPYNYCPECGRTDGEQAPDEKKVAEIERLRAALGEICAMADPNNYRHGRSACARIARDALVRAHSEELDNPVQVA